MANGPRTIYSRRQRMAPGQYDTPLADFLDRLPDYVNQFQQNQLAIGRQKLQEQRYQDSISRQNRLDAEAREQQNIENLKYIQRQKEKKAIRAGEALDKAKEVNRAEYESVLEGLSKYDYGAKSKTAKTFGYDTEAQNYSSLADTQFDNLVSSREKIDKLKSLSSTGTYYDANPIMQSFSPNEINELKERDPLYYADFIKTRNVFSEQESTGMRAMPKNISNRLSQVNNIILDTERKLIDAYRDMNYDVRAMEEALAKGEDFQLPEAIKETMKLTGGDLSNVTSLDRDLKDYINIRNNIQSQYKIVPPKPKEGEDAKMIKMPDGTMVPAMWAETADDEIPFNIARPDYDPSEGIKVPETVNEAIDQEDRVDSMYILSSAPEDSPEYKKAMETLSQGRDVDITTPKPLPGLSGLIERLSVAGRGIEEGQREDSGFRINPNALAFDLPPEGVDNPEYYDRVAQQFNIEVDKLSTLTLQPEQYEGTGKRGANQKAVELNSSLKSRDNLVNQVKALYKKIPKTKKFANQIKKFKDIINSNPTGVQVVLDRKARGGKGAFKFNKRKLSQSDKLLLAEINKDLNFEEPQESNQDLLQRLSNVGGAMASPAGRAGMTSQPIQLFE
tara:strand:+ start:753 stop:2606 length:1854 start_codon:yes stop_codon:yes gene_type:complete